MDAPGKPALVTVKVRPPLRRWLKARAAIEGVTMYALIEQLLADGWSSRREAAPPWEGAPAPRVTPRHVDAALDR